MCFVVYLVLFHNNLKKYQYVIFIDVQRIKIELSGCHPEGVF